MPKCLRYERLMPRELETVLAKRPIVYLPVGPLEWHGEHCAFGCDPLRASVVLEAAWRKVGGVLMPPLFVGTDGTTREGKATRWGMEMFAHVQLPGSIYVREETFRAVIEDTLTFLQRNGFKLCVLATGHEARNQKEICDEAAKKFRRRGMKVLAWYASLAPRPSDPSVPSALVHGGARETSELMAFDAGLVVPRRRGTAARDRSVGLGRESGQPVSAEIGRKIVEHEAGALVGVIRDRISKLGLD